MVMLVLFSWCWHVLVTSMVGVSGTLVFHVLLRVVSDVLSIGGWFCSTYLACSILQKLVDEVFFLEGIDIHVGDGRKQWILVNGVGDSAPSLLNSSNVPLVDDSHDFVGFTLINFLEQQFVFRVDNDLFLVWCNPIQQINEIVGSIFVE